MRSPLALQLLFGVCIVPIGAQGARLGTVPVWVPREEEVFLWRPSSSPSHSPSASPSQHPSPSPSAQPTGSPSASPSHSPSFRPSTSPSSSPSSNPTSSPSSSPTYSSQPTLFGQQSSLRVSQKMLSSDSDGGMKVSQALGFWLTWLIAAIIALAILLIGTGVARKIRQRRDNTNNTSDEQNPDDNMENQDEKGASFDIVEALGLGVDAFFDTFVISPGDVSLVGRVVNKSMEKLEWEEQTETTGTETAGTGWCTRTNAQTETIATNFQ